MATPIKLKTVFMGTSSFAATILSSLIENKFNIISVYTRPDARIGRDQMIEKSAVKLVAEKAGINVFEPLKFGEDEIGKLKKQEPDLIIVAAYGKILPRQALDIPGFGAINVHASLLPKFRGPSPVQNAILEGENETGTTIMLMNEGIDTGDILAQRKISISPKEKYPELLKKMSRESAQLLLETLTPWAKRKLKPVAQENSEASYCQMIERQDGRIIWSDESISIYNRWRAFYVWPGIFTYWEKNGYNLRLILHEIRLCENETKSDVVRGQVFESSGKICVRTGQGSIILEEVQLEGKSKVSITDFINGYPNFVGSVLK
jgi:methionyl-tRNA formyltransferase